jgi:16S rRNA (guanine966-N2)-methyltransferase
MSGKVKIIGGLFRGKLLCVQEHDDLRPTPNRVRETLFNWLMHDIRHLHCYDAFAGSGALGFEACSRGALSVVLTENDAANFQTLQKNIQTLHAALKNSNSSTPEAYFQNFFQFIAQTKKIFDLVFLDPPYRAHLLPQCLEVLASSSALKEGGLVYLESDQPLPNTASWTVLKSHRASSIYFGLYQKNR